MACKQRLRPRGCCDGGGLNKGKNEKTLKYTNSGTGCQLRLQASQTKQSLVCYFVLDLQTKTAAPCVVPRPPTTTPTCKQRLRPRVLFQGPPPTTTPTCKQRLRPRVLFQGPPPTTTPTCKQRLRPRVLFQGPPAPTTSTCKQRLWPRVLFQGPPPQQPPCCCLVPTNKDWGPVCCSYPCTASEITTTTPTLTPPPAAAAAATTTSASTAWLLFCLYMFVPHGLQTKTAAPWLL